MVIFVAREKKEVEVLQKEMLIELMYKVMKDAKTWRH